MHSRLSFFTAFKTTFSTYRTGNPSKYETIAWKRVDTPGKKVGKAKVACAVTEIRATALWDTSNERSPGSFRVDTVYLDADGTEVARGRVKKAASADEALAEVENRLSKLG
jgi:hypothetical protein